MTSSYASSFVRGDFAAKARVFRASEGEEPSSGVEAQPNARVSRAAARGRNDVVMGS